MTFGFDEYQRLAHETADYSNKGFYPHWVYPALKLCGEAGEVAEKLGKVLRDKEGKISNVDLEEICLELGDVLWYVSELCSVLGVSLRSVAYNNIVKLGDRKNRGKIHGDGDKR